ncbi:hypothetical protein [Dermatophilus congolensis]|uniref:Uncharacterized protein n=1 Tax=Dermatophilus congolensis TaxID=1863 RepID=A0A239VM85_9MICO|nr:hypothetical protein [Dermatophilus congolensis]MBO3129346.1 hypothetical protein [Dermatophilus congolensis]MBO3132021.1 hypothetical protein [Dermatophilus congolensis]MBO3133823.1 hypothetical protein [Dermatophilus congolensis]MBO3136054.1 hypothetical protein [Dermatophilus congolensis]MBO3138296.1 hypothetical protein [Dermatophilus congolensis]
MNLDIASRRYAVTLAHRCELGTSNTREISARSLTELLRVLHEGENNYQSCSYCGEAGMAISSISVVLEEEALTERLGAYADELFAAV